MVQNSRETPGAGTLRPLNLPVPITVQEDACQRPLTLSKSPSQRGPRLSRLRVASIDNTWKIDEEWWREKPIVRMYYQVTTEDGRRITLFQDLTTGDWYQQRG